MLSFLDLYLNKNVNVGRFAVSYRGLTCNNAKTAESSTGIKCKSFVLVAILQAPCFKRQYAVYEIDKFTTKKESIQLKEESDFFR